MAYSVLAKVKSEEYKNQKFYFYKNSDESLAVFNKQEADKIADIFNQHPDVFSEIEIVPRSNDEIKLLENFWGEDGRKLDFEIQMVEDECSGLTDKIHEAIPNGISGIDREETVRQTFENK